MSHSHSKKDCIVQYKNCRILRNHKIVQDDLWVRNGRILNPEKVFFDEHLSADYQVDCNNAIIAPGFIDVQINGAFGVDFSLLTQDIDHGLPKVAQGLLAHGVTSFCPTIVSSPPQVYKKLLPKMKRKCGSKDGAGILGIHIEGPFISCDKKGAHPEQFLRSIDTGIEDLLEIYGTLEHCSILTLAPELPKAIGTIRNLIRQGIVVSLGHSVANLVQGEEAVAAGATFVTHLFNAMLPFHHRDPHLVGLLASDNIPSGTTVYYGMITDGIHTHASAIRIAYRTHPKGFVIVTDAIPAMGLPPGVHHLAAQSVEITDGRAVIAGTDTLCGSIANMNECVKHFLKAAGCTKVEALESATLHPAQLLGISDKKGTLDFNSDADFIMLNDDLDVLETYIAGGRVWRKSTVL